MPFWTYFWVIVPPVVLISTSIIFYFVTGNEEDAQ